MRHFAAIIMLTLSLNCFGQYQFDKTKISDQTKLIVAKIEKENSLMGSAVGEGGTRPEQFDNFIELKKTATKIELTELTNYPNGVVRCYSFWALSYDNSTNLLPILIKHIPDNESVCTMFGCIKSYEKVGDFFINLVTPQYVDLKAKKLTPAEFEYLDSFLIYTPNNLYARNHAISRAKQSGSLYTKARQLVITENNQQALVTLAKFKKKQDIPLILKNNQLFYTYKAISQFPDTAFLPLLKKSLYGTIDDDHWSTEWRELYKAIACFRNDMALHLLKIPFTQIKYQNIRQYHIDFIFGAIQEFYTPAYDELLWKMWENEKKISPNVFNLLYPKNPEKAFQLTKNTIQNAGDFYYLSTETFSENGESPINLIDIMLDTILVHDRELAVELINNNIREINVHQFPIFADKALKLKDTSFVTSLFNRLEKESNPHIYLKATKVLIALNDININKRIVEVSKQNPSLREGWGGKEFSKTLKENGIK